MQKSPSSSWVTKAGTFLAFGGLLGQSAPALANGWTTASIGPAQSLNHATTVTAASHQAFASIIHNHGTAPAPGVQSTANLLSAQSQAGVLSSLVHHTTAANTTATNRAGWQTQATTAFVAPNRTGSLFNASLPTGVAGPGLQLDLTSGNANIVLGSSLFNGASSATIAVGGKAETFSAGSSVTPAEYIAIRQILSGNVQTLTINGGGAATGGSFRLDAAAGAQVGEIVVPRNVVALDFASSLNNPVVTGDIVNFGTIYGLTSHGSNANVSLNALDIINGYGATITTNMPAAMVRALGGVFAGGSLELTAGDTIANAGTISSQGNVLLSSGTGNLINTGFLTSASGNINLASANAGSAINVNATGGTFSAVKGDINVRDASYNGAANVNLTGGDYLSRNFNIYAGTGEITGNVGQLTGTLNTVAGVDHLQASTANLVLGNNSVSGDPTFINSNGNIVINGENDFSESVAIIASGNITANSSGQIKTNGNAISLIAGANITQGTNPTSTTISGGSSDGGQTTSDVTVSVAGPSATGGNVDLSGSKVVNVLDSSSQSLKGGDINLIAFAGNVTTAPNSVINAQAGTAGDGGNVTVIGALGVNIGGIRSGGAAAGGAGGAINIAATAPNSDNGNAVTFGTDGKINSGNKFIPDAVNGLNSLASVAVNGDLITAPVGQTSAAAGVTGASAGSITIAAPGSIQAQNLLAFGGGGAGGNATTTKGGNGGNGAPISLSTADGVITVNGQINSSGGGGGGAGSSDTAGGSGGTGGSAGQISLTVTPVDGTANYGIGVSGGVYAASGGNGGAASAGEAGGGGASFGGGGGGGVSSIVATNVGVAGGSGGAGYFGGAGGYASSTAGQTAAGGGGGYTFAGASGTPIANSSASTGGVGSGVLVNNTQLNGGTLTGTQGGSGTGASTSNGQAVPTSNGGANVSITNTIVTDPFFGTQSGGAISLGGDVYGNVVNITAPQGLVLNGNVVGTTSVAIASLVGSITQSSTTYSIITPTLNITALTGGSAPFSGVGFQTRPLATTATAVNINGTMKTVILSDSTSGTLNYSGSDAGALLFAITMGTAGGSVNLNAIPSIVTNFTVATNNGTIGFNSAGLTAGGPTDTATTGAVGSVVLTANNISFPGKLAIVADNNVSGFVGGSINITTNNINGSPTITLGSGNGQLSLSAQGHTATNGTAGSITFNAPTANVVIANAGALNVSYDTSTFNTSVPTTNGGKIVLNANSLTGSGTALNFDASGIGGGSGGSIAITLNTSSNIAIGTAAGQFAFTATSGSQPGLGVTQTGGSVSLINNGTGSLKVDPNAIQVVPLNSATPVNGGSITLSAGTIVGTQAGQPLVIVNNGIGTGFGGKINLTETAASAPVKLGSAAGDDFYFVAQGGGNSSANGSVSFTTNTAILLTTYTNGSETDAVVNTNSGNYQGSVTIGTASGSLNGGGGTLILSGTNISNGTTSGEGLSFTAAGVGTGFGGSVKLTVADTQSLNIGKDLTNGQFQFNVANGASGIVAGGVSVNIGSFTDTTGNGVLTIDPAAIVQQVVSKTNANVNGGTLQLVAPTIAASPTVSTKTAMILNVSGAGKAPGGFLTYAQTAPGSTLNIGTKTGQVELLAAAGKSGGSGGSVTAISGGNLNVTVAGLSVKAAGATGAGGHISLGAQNLKNDPGFGNLVVIGSLSADAGGASAQGGTIGLSSNSSTPFNIGLTSKNTNGVQGGLSANGFSTSSGAGGQISIITGGTGGIVVQKALTNAQYFQFLYASKNATGDFLLNASIGGTKTAQILIAPTDNDPGMASNIIAGTAGKLVVSMAQVGALPAGDILLQASGDIRGLSTTVKGVTTTKSVNLVTPELTAITTNGDIDVSAAIPLKSTLTVDTLSAGGNVNLYSSGNLTTAGFTDGVVPLVALNNIRTLATPQAANSAGQGSMSAGGDFSLRSKGVLSGKITSIKNLELEDLAFILKLAIYFDPSVVIHPPAKPDQNTTLTGTNGGTNSGGGTSQSSNRTSTMMVSNAAASTPTPVASAFTISANGKGAFSIDCDHSLFVTGSGFVGLTSLAVATTNPGGSITGPGIIQAKSVSLQTSGGDIGSSGAALNVNAATIAANTGFAASANNGNVYLNSVGTLSLTTSVSNAGGYNLTTAGPAKITGITAGDGGITVTSAKTLTVDTLTSVGAVNVMGGGATTIGSITTTGSNGDITLETTTGALQTSLNAKVQAVNAGILFENLNTKSGSIIVAAGSDIETGNGNNGVGKDITFTIGDAPLTPFQGTQPAKYVSVTPNQSGTVYFGINGITAAASKGTGNTLTAKGANIIFNTGALKATAIKLNGATTITADPPTTSGATSSSKSSQMQNHAMMLNASPNVQPSSPSQSATSSSIAIPAISTSQPLTGGVSLQVQPTNTSQTVSPSIINTQAVQIQDDKPANIAADTDARWISESEIESGLIPANFITDGQFALPSEVSSVFEYSASGHDLRRGSVVFAPKKDTIVKTPYGPLAIGAKSVVLVLCLQDALAVYNFDDNHKDAVNLTIGDEKISVTPGKHLLVSGRKARDFEEINAAQAFAFRGVSKREISGNGRILQLFTADFNHCQAIGTVMPLRKLVASSDSEAKDIGQRLLKTSAILSQLTARGERYRMMPRPSMLASR